MYFKLATFNIANDVLSTADVCMEIADQNKSNAAAGKFTTGQNGSVMQWQYGTNSKL